MDHRAPGRTSQREKVGSLFWSLVAVLFGWTLFFYWWGQVVQRNQPEVLRDLLVALALFTLALFVLTSVWIAHNRRLARRGSRNDVGVIPSIRVIRALRCEQDALGRPIVLPSPALLREAAVIRIEIRDGRKSYEPERKTLAG